ncbi:hypothetical protein GCM10011387_11330 [Pedobacter quisquiliarum]|uniref:Aerotolerance regulator N-terminal domain-containing protein n=1 Tax=Pedobacter quisquiliarum TaxID=1834438 RepID=A0A916XBG0_9SPHI|nr:BatA domain-containing protein [Pedobacter quisquiliarum]GGC59397.1 hypothetical protein GCM10011387_11330 [Pedobacter quisquiliarum]
MIQILYPLGLLAALGILVPVIIHLWNIKSGKTLKIGSVFLLGTPTNQRSRSFRVQDWPLLLLRTLLILLAAMLIAEPVYVSTQKATKQAGWVLLEKAEFSNIWKQEHATLDSLIKAGYKIHDLAYDFPKIEVKDSATTFSTPSSGKLPYHALLKQLDHLHPAGTNIHIFAANERGNFRGVEPAKHLNVHWELLQPDSTNSTWLAAAYQLQNGGVRTLEAVAGDKGTYYKTTQTSTGANPEIPIDTATTVVQLYAPNNMADAEYVRAAVKAIAQYTERKISIAVLTDINKLSPQTKVLFWLSDRKLTDAQRAALPRGTRLFSYEGDKVQNIKSSIQDAAGVALQNVTLLKSTQNASKKRIDNAAAPDKGIWIDGTGQPVLALTREGKIDHYRFYSRFRPDWTEMVWSDQMVYFLLPVVLPESAAHYAFRDGQKAPVSKADLNNAQQIAADANLKSQVVATDVSPWFWYLLLLLFLTERWITYNKRKVVS